MAMNNLAIIFQFSIPFGVISFIFFSWINFYSVFFQKLGQRHYRRNYRQTQCIQSFYFVLNFLLRSIRIPWSGLEVLVGFIWGFLKPEKQTSGVTHGKNFHTLRKLTTLWSRYYYKLYWEKVHVLPFLKCMYPLTWIITITVTLKNFVSLMCFFILRNDLLPLDFFFLISVIIRSHWTKLI